MSIKQRSGRLGLVAVVMQGFLAGPDESLEAAACMPATLATPCLLLLPLTPDMQSAVSPDFLSTVAFKRLFTSAAPSPGLTLHISTAVPPTCGSRACFSASHISRRDETSLACLGHTGMQRTPPLHSVPPPRS